MVAAYIKKHFKMKPEVSKIFDDLEAYKDYCRNYMLKFDEKDLYKSEQYRKFEKQRNWLLRQQARENNQ